MTTQFKRKIQALTLLEWQQTSTTKNLGRMDYFFSSAFVSLYLSPRLAFAILLCRSSWLSTEISSTFFNAVPWYMIFAFYWKPCQPSIIPTRDQCKRIPPSFPKRSDKAISLAKEPNKQATHSGGFLLVLRDILSHLSLSWVMFWMKVVFRMMGKRCHSVDSFNT